MRKIHTEGILSSDFIEIAPYRLSEISRIKGELECDDFYNPIFYKFRYCSRMREVEEHIENLTVEENKDLLNTDGDLDLLQEWSEYDEELENFIEEEKV